MRVIDANDHSPQFMNLPYAFSVEENNDVNQLIGQIIATDQDSGRNAELRYRITAGIVFLMCTSCMCTTSYMLVKYVL